MSELQKLLRDWTQEWADAQPLVYQLEMEAADALDAQAQEIARLTAKLPCGHLETDADSYGGCAACGVLRSLESAEKECDALRERLAEVERDAQRYRWMKSHWFRTSPDLWKNNAVELEAFLDGNIDLARGGA